MAAAASPSASADFDDELSFNELTFGDDTDPEESSPRPSNSPTASGHEDDGYDSLPTATSRHVRRRGVAVPLHGKLGSSPLASESAPVLPRSFDATRLSPRMSSSPRIRSRPRARSRTEGPKRGVSVQQQPEDKVVVVRNLRTGEDAMTSRFQQQVRSKFGEHVRSLVADDDAGLAFVECRDSAAAVKVEAHCNGLAMGNGVILTAERCERVTPGQDPRDYERFGGLNDVIVLKNLPFNITEAELGEAIVAVAKGCDAPLELKARRNSAGTFSGMAFARYETVAAAAAACRALDGVTLAGREIRAEFKRADPAQRKRLGSERSGSLSLSRNRDRSPEDRAQRDIDEKLRAFVSAPEQATLDFPASLSSSLRKHVHTTAASLGLHHTSEKREAGQRFVRVRKGQPPSPLSSSPSGSLAEERVYDTRTPASIRNDVRGALQAHGRIRADSAGRIDWRRSASVSSSFGGKRSALPPQQQRGRSDSFGRPDSPLRRPRAVTVSGASMPIEILRPPRGPDGTRGFHARSPAKDAL